MTVDHIVYGAENLQAGVDELAGRLGMRAAPGGKHVDRGTHNALLALGGDSYLEIIARDPDQPQAAGPVAFALDRILLPRLVGWAVRVTDIEWRAQQARERGYDPGPVQSMSRRRPDGISLEWQLTRHMPRPETPGGALLDRLGQLAAPEPVIADRSHSGRPASRASEPS